MPNPKSSFSFGQSKKESDRKKTRGKQNKEFHFVKDKFGGGGNKKDKANITKDWGLHFAKNCGKKRVRPQGGWVVVPKKMRGGGGELYD